MGSGIGLGGFLGRFVCVPIWFYHEIWHSLGLVLSTA